MQVLGDLAPTLTQQTRYDTADLLLAAAPDVFSRFMLTPKRPAVAGSDGVGPLRVGHDALATSGLAAFLGFACRAFRHHDYMLGRLNCQQLLKDVFVLAEDNGPVFQGGAAWHGVDKGRHLVRDRAGRCFLPIVPLLGRCADPSMAAPWPKGALDPTTFRDPVGARFRAMADQLAGADGSGLSLKRVFIRLATLAGRDDVGDWAVEKMREALQGAADPLI